MDTRFSASLDRASWFITGALILFAGYMANFLYDYRDSTTSLSFLFIGLLFVLLPVLFLFRPMRYSLTPYSLVIHRLAGEKVIDRTGIASMHVVSRESMGHLYRTFGNGGVFGYTGHFYSNRKGAIRMYGTQRKNFVLIELTNGRQLVITPDNPDGLVEAFYSGTR